MFKSILAFSVFALLTQSHTEIIRPNQSAQSDIRGSTSTVDIREVRPSVEEVRAYVRQQAAIYGISQDTAECVIKHESTFCWRNGFYEPDIKGDDGNSIGCFQISKIWHPEVPESCSKNLECSTKWSLQRMVDGYIKEWSAFREYCADMRVLD